MNVFDLNAKIGLDSSDYEKGLSNAEKASDSFGTHIGDSLKAANNVIKEFQSRFSVIAAGLDDWAESEEGLNAKISSLNSIIEVQKTKISALKSEYQKLIDNGLDPASDKAVQFRTQINEEKAALKTSEKELQNNQKALKSLGEESDDSGKKLSKFGDIAKTAGKAIGAAFAAASAAVGGAVVNITKKAVDSYGEYEQLVGGMDAIFGDASKKVQENAARAYETAGISANKYMETTTSFAAALVKGLGGDTERAAEIADRAIQDMGDNANRFGSNIENIQLAYRNFARQNYTLLDNLNLGYGGTQLGMYQLLQDAAALNEEFANTAKFSLDSQGHLTAEFSDMIEAIHIVQQNLNVTGTTADEAGHTMQGSMKAAKAAWENLITGLANGNADVDTLLDNFLTSAGTAAMNLVPTISTALQGVVKLAEGFLQRLPEYLAQFVPVVSEGISTLFSSITQALPKVFELGASLLGTLVQAILDNLPSLISTAFEIVITLANGIGEALPELIPQVVGVIMTIVEQLTNPDSLMKIIDAALSIIMGLVQGIVAAIPVLIEHLPIIIENIIDFLIKAIPTIIDAGIELLSSIIEAIPIVITAIIKALPSIISGIIKFFSGAIPQLIIAGTKLFLALISAMPQIRVEIVKAMPEIIQAIISAFKDMPKMMADIGKDIVKGLWEGIKSLGSWLWDKVSGWAGDLFGGIKDFFGIHSPSKKFAYIGENMSKGLGYGFIDEMESLEKDMIAAVPNNFETDYSFQNRANGRATRYAENNNLTIILEVDKQKFAKAVVDLSKLETQRQGRVLFSV